MKSKRLFITGISGTAGRALAKIASSKEYQVAGTIYQNLPKDIVSLKEENCLKLYKIDLKDQKKIKDALTDFEPDFIIHLAGKVLGGSDKQVSNPQIYDENILIFKNVLSAIERITPNARFILSSGCLVYSKPTSPVPILEKDILKLPKIDSQQEPYRASKLEQEKLLSESTLEYIIARPTQFTGPGKIPGVVEYFIAREIMKIQSGIGENIRVKNKLGQVDILDARDVAMAYLTLLEKGSTGQIYHISSGNPTTVEHIAKLLLEIVGLNPKNYQVLSTDKEQVVYFNFSSAKLRKLGWNLQYSLKDTLTSYWKYFKNQKAKI